ncbi:hypothetical protein DFP74_1651 [Nocardiopsis sp. Huas11]|nr:hypothetical protein DFP74_1651 [Nocardiopsis sp. Huas11]
MARPHKKRPTGRAWRTGGCVLGAVLALVVIAAAPAWADLGDAHFFAYQLKDVIRRLTRLGQALAVSVATLFIVVAGLRWMMAGGEPGEIDKAKRGFQSAAIGYGIAIAGQAILYALDFLGEFEGPP